MMHTQIENEEIIERYVRNQLAEEQRLAFEEHILDCETCFENLQATERFIAGIRNAAARGLLNDEPAVAPSRGQAIWFKWAFAASSCAAVILAVTIGWAYLFQMPRLRGKFEQVAAELRAERAKPAQVEQRKMTVDQAEANIPLVMLESSRAAEVEPASILLQPKAKHLVLWIELGPSRSRDFRLEVISMDHRVITSLDHVERGPYGALSASLPADMLPAGDFLIRVISQDLNPASVAGEYRLRVRRP